MENINTLIKNKILSAMNNNLPGKHSHLKMIPDKRTIQTHINSDTKKSAVLLLLFPENNTFNLIFIKKAKDKSMHSEQIAFPGGKFENRDSNLKETALRESKEEIGINPKDVKIIKELTHLHIPVSGFCVKPFAGIINYKPEIKINRREIQKHYTLDIKKLITAKPVTKNIYVRNEKITAPFFIFDEFEIWGASAMILSEFIDLIKPEF